MPFFLYNVTNNQYQLVRKIQLAGKSGPLARLQQQLNTAGQSPFPWHATAGDVVAALGCSAEHEIVFDLKPKAKRNVSLYRLCDVWGYSCDNWTPLALRLECLFVDLADPDPTSFKTAFACPGGHREKVGEFLYVLGGVTGGTWTWGQVGRVNGALLWRDALHYLATALMGAIP